MSDHNALNKDTVKIIGVDIGFGKVKTANFVFKNAIHKLSSGSALKTNILAVGDKSYSVGGRRLEVKDSKILDDNAYLLTLVAIAKELKNAGINEAHIYLAEGLPLTKFAIQKQDFLNYLKDVELFPELAVAEKDKDYNKSNDVRK